jgi:Zn finger protein HypA/HybF involved in hydrogenase expression
MPNLPSWKKEFIDFLDVRGCVKPSAPVRIKQIIVIREFKDVHADKYDYSLFEYVSAKEKSTIICPKHGAFSLNSNHHKRGVGCGKCANFGFNAEKHIADFQKVHGNEYDYSQVKYVNTQTPVRILCKTHGIFQQSPEKHKSGHKCPKCSGKGLSIAEKIGRYNLIHKNKYDYSLIRSFERVKKIFIICPKHGLFSQSPSNHLKHGCDKCAADIRSQKKTLKQDEVIKDFIATHGDIYDYTRVKYFSTHEKVELICPNHGSFFLTPSHHKKGVGCNKCSGHGLSSKEHIAHWSKVHDDKYDYSLTKYKGDKSPVKIICEDHGIFEQLPTHHKRGVGCPQCGNRDFDALYIWKDHLGNHKIGVTKLIKGEARILQCAKNRQTTPRDIRIIRVGNAEKHEQLLLKTFTRLPYLGGDGWTEFRTLTDVELDEINDYFDLIEGSVDF